MKQRFERLLNEFRKNFVRVELLYTLIPNETQQITFYVSNQEVAPHGYAPFVHIAVHPDILKASEEIFESTVWKGIQLARKLILVPPTQEISFQGTVNLGYAPLFQYQGLERRSAEDRRGGKDRRQMERRKAERRCGGIPNQYPMKQTIRRTGQERRQGERRKEERRKGDRRIEPIE